MSSNIIEVRNFTKKYGDFVAVDNISFSVEEGIIFAFLGPNGAGKSTTINTLCTIFEKTSGDLIINGNNTTDNKSCVRSDIGIVFQDSILDKRLTVEENIKFHCEFYNVPKNEVKERIDFVLELVDLTKWRNALVSSLSGGMKRRVEIARGLVHFPKVLFLDEPTTGLDPQTRANIWEYIKKLQKEKNITIFLTTHYMDEAEICDKVAIIDHGKIVAFDTPENLKKQYATTIMNVTLCDSNESESAKEITIKFLNQNDLKYEIKENKLQVFSPKIDSIFKFISANQSYIKDIEINRGTLNDVFLNITGKEIRL